jgi:hypothetical protein
VSAAKKDEKYMQNQKEAVPTEDGQNKQTKPKKKEGRIQQVWEMSQKGASVKDIAKKTGLRDQIIRSYIWRKQNPEKFKALLKRYFEKRKKKTLESATEEPNL